MTKLTTHVLDIYSGKPGKGIKVDLHFIEKGEKKKPKTGTTKAKQGQTKTKQGQQEVNKSFVWSTKRKKTNAQLALRACPYDLHDPTHNLQANVLHATLR